MDGLGRRVRHGCLPSRGASPGRDAAASEARVRTVCKGRHHPSTKMPPTMTGRRLVPERRAAGQACTMVIRKVKSSRSEEHTSELQSLMRTSYAVFGLTKQK